MARERVLSRHRLPRPYRVGIVLFWLAPIAMLVATLIAGRGLTPELLHPRFLLPLLLMALPAVYIWQEGVDVLPGGIVARVHLPRYHAYADLTMWRYDAQPDRHVLTVWGCEHVKVLECRGGHLTNLPLLLDTLSQNLPGESKA